MVKASAWQSFDRQLNEPISARLWRRPYGVAWNAVPEPMEEYTDP
jgi:hypothetical protein